jgi:DNA-binding GntR family transcriptional regulator
MAASRSTSRKTPSITGAPTLASIVQEKIAAEIATGVFAPGIHLEEKELASRYQVSRTPIREALRELASLGAVDIKARRGVLVADMRGERLLKTLEVVADLEASCARYAAERMTDAQRAELDLLHKELGDAVRRGDSARYDRGNLQFHLRIHAGSANDILSDAVGQMRRRIIPYTRAQRISDPERLNIAYREHEAIVSALENRNGELAYHATRAHVMTAGQAFEDLAL